MARKLFKYDKEDMKKALTEIDEGVPVKTAARKYKIPRTTLIRHNRNPDKVLQIGRKTAFSAEQEEFLAKWAVNMAKAGFPLSKETFLASVARFKTSLNIQCSGSRNWYTGFMKRHQILSHRAYQNLTRSRADISIEKIRNWFQEVEEYLMSSNQFHILKEPRRVFNADETAFYLNPKGGKVLAERGSKNVYLANSNDEKENVTVLLGGNAMGELAPLMVVFRYKRMPEQLASSLPDSWTIGRSENGWMTQETMYEYVANYFYPWLVNNGIELPVIFFLDGHVSHLSLDLAEFCSGKGIILVALYPNATHLIQPMDVAVFKGLKEAWKSRVQEWRIENDFRELKKHEFCPLLQQVLQGFNGESLKNGFKKCGLVPWDRTVVATPLSKDLTVIKNFCTESNLFKKLLEERLGEIKLKQFRMNSGQWKGAVADKSLYYLWLQSAAPVSEGSELEPVEEMMGAEVAASIQEGDWPELQEDDWNGLQEDARPEFQDTRSELLEEGRQELQGDTRSELQEEARQELQVEARQELQVEARQELQVCQKVTKFIIPSPFKKNLLFRRDQPSTSKTVTPKVRMPAVISSPEARQYLQRKEENKKRLLERREEAKEAREAKKRAIEEEKCAKKLKREEEKVKKGKKEPARKRLFSEDESDSDGQVAYSGSSSGGEWQEDNESETEELGALPPAKREKGEFVVVKYDDAIFAGIITEVLDDGARVKVMKRNGQLWKWPDREDVCFYEWHDVLGHLKAPKKFSTRREIYSVPELENFF